MNVLDEIPLDSREHLDRVGEQVLLLDEYVQLKPATTRGTRDSGCCPSRARSMETIPVPITNAPAPGGMDSTTREGQFSVLRSRFMS
jgi:hypothetical protein